MLQCFTLQRSHLWRLCEIETVLRVACFPLAKLFQAHNSERESISDLCKDNDHVRKADKEEVQQLLAPGTHKYTSDLKHFLLVHLRRLTFFEKLNIPDLKIRIESLEVWEVQVFYIKVITASKLRFWQFVATTIVLQFFYKMGFWFWTTFCTFRDSCFVSEMILTWQGDTKFTAQNVSDMSEKLYKAHQQPVKTGSCQHLSSMLLLHLCCKSWSP